MYKPNIVCYNYCMKTKNFILYVDDTGFNAHEKVSDFLKNEKATSAGIIVREELVPTLEEILSDACKKLKESFGTEEFHFTEIYNRDKKGSYKDIDFEETYDIINLFANIFLHYSIKICVHTSSIKYEGDYQNLLKNINEICKVLHLPENEKSQTLFLTYIKSKIHVEKLTKRAHISKIISDEGLRKPGAKETIPGTNTTIEFKSSKDEPLLQLADFAAWILTRSKNILDKAAKNGKISEIDKRVLSVYSLLSDNYINLNKQVVHIGDMTNFSYDDIVKNLTETIR